MGRFHGVSVLSPVVQAWVLQTLPGDLQVLAHRQAQVPLFMALVWNCLVQLIKYHLECFFGCHPHKHMYVCVHMYVHMYMYVYVCIHTLLWTVPLGAFPDLCCWN